MVEGVGCIDAHHCVIGRSEIKFRATPSPCFKLLIIYGKEIQIQNRNR